MAGAKTAYLEQLQIAYVLGLNAFSPPSTYYVALSLDAFDRSLIGSTFTEVSASDYARLSLPNDGTHFSTPAGANPTTVQSLTDWTFPAAAFAWGTVRSLYLMDAGSGGHPFYGTDLPGSGVPMGIGSQLIVPAGTFIAREGVAAA